MLSITICRWWWCSLECGWSWYDWGMPNNRVTLLERIYWSSVFLTLGSMQVKPIMTWYKPTSQWHSKLKMSVTISLAVLSANVCNVCIKSLLTAVIWLHNGLWALWRCSLSILSHATFYSLSLRLDWSCSDIQGITGYRDDITIKPHGYTLRTCVVYMPSIMRAQLHIVCSIVFHHGIVTYTVCTFVVRINLTDCDVFCLRCGSNASIIRIG